MGHVLYQRCRVHLDRNLDEALKPFYTKFSKIPEEYERFSKAYTSFACAKNWTEARTWLRFLLYYPTFSRPQFQGAKNLFLRALPQIVPAFFHPRVVALDKPGGKLFPVYRSPHHADGPISRRGHRPSDGEVDPLVVPVSQVHQPLQAVLVHQREIAASVGGCQDRQAQLVESGSWPIGGAHNQRYQQHQKYHGISRLADAP